MLNTRRPAPVSTATLTLVLDAVADPRSTAATVAEVVAVDPGLSSKVIALANSAQFGLANEVSRLEMAVHVVGTTSVQTLALASAGHLLDPHEALPGLRAHALRTACGARLLAAWAGCGTSEAFAAGLLHDIGELLLWQASPTDYAAAYGSWDDHEAQVVAERRTFGADHAAVGAEHLASWHVPDLLVDAVAGHGGPWTSVAPLALVVGAAEAMVGGEADPPAIRALGVPMALVDEFREVAASEADALTAVLVPV